MERESSKHGPRLDNELERELQGTTRSGQPPHKQEQRETEAAGPGHLALPEDHQPGVPGGMTASQVNLRSDIARHLPPHELPASRDSLLRLLRSSGAPDGIMAAVARLPAGRDFANAGEIARALGLPGESDPPG